MKSNAKEYMYIGITHEVQCDTKFYIITLTFQCDSLFSCACIYPCGRAAWVRWSGRAKNFKVEIQILSSLKKFIELIVKI